MGLAIADGFTQLVAHLFAHIPLAGPGNLGDPRYREWAHERMTAAEQADLHHDAQVIARIWSLDPELDVLHGLFDLHGSIERFLATSRRSLADLDAGDVDNPALLAALRGLDGSDAAELVHATLSALADGYAGVLDEIGPALILARARVEPWLARVVPHVPELDGARVELVWAMGEHGRALPKRILVGAPAAWNRIDPAWAAVLAAHEALVRSSPSDEYVVCESFAIAELATRMAGADGELASAHAAWLASLDLSGLD